MGIEQVDIAVRAAGAVQLATLAAIFALWTAGPVRWAGPLFALAVAAHLWCPVVYGDWRADPVAVPLPYLGCASAAGWFWIFSRAVFDDRFTPGIAHWSVVGALIALGYAARMTDAGSLAAVAPQFLSIAVVVGALVQAARERPDDLVRVRRRLRDGLIAAAGAYALGILVIEVFLGGERATRSLELAGAAGIVLLTSTAVVALVRIRAGLFAVPGREVPPGELAATDRALADRLVRLMAADKAYREEGLTIGALAQRLGCSEHRLRRIINAGLGHRNFSRFVNGYRLDEAKARLADPADRVPILTIALETGFGSIGPFNRAFKEHTGMTPGDYRRRMLQADEPGKT